jgi:hypothetical protein
MKSLREWLVLGLLAACVAVLVPIQAMASAPDEEKKEAAEEADDSDAEAEAEGEAEEAEAEGETEAAGEEASAGADTTALFGTDEESAPAEEKTEEVATPEEPKLLQGTWTKKIVFATDDKSFTFQPKGMVQPRFKLSIYPDEPADNTLAGTGFDLKRARFGFTAVLFEMAKVYVDTDWNSGGGSLVDYFIDLDPFKGVAALQVGYFRPYFGRQILMATSQIQMIEYAQAWQDGTLNLNLGRDHGLGIHGLVAKGIEYGVGVWNGERGFNTAGGVTANDIPYPANIDFALGGRLVIHPLAFTDIGVAVPLGDESDTAVSAKPGLAVGAAIMYNKRHNRDILEPTTNTYQLYYDSQLKLGIELAFKWKGLTLESEFFMHKVAVQDDADQAIKDAVSAANDTVRENLDGTGIGMYAQLGYFIKPADLEIAARFDMVDESTDLRGMRMYPGIGATYYIFGNNLKVQLMYRLNMGTGFEEGSATVAADPGWVPTTHEMFLMLQAAI